MSTDIVSDLLSTRRSRSLVRRIDEHETESEANADEVRSAHFGIYIWQSLRTSFPLWIADELALISAVCVAGGFCYLTGQPGLTDQPGALHAATLGMVLSLGLLISNFVVGLYPGVGLSPAAELRHCATSSMLLFSVYFLMTAFRDGVTASHATLLAFSLLIILFVLPGLRGQARRMAAKTSWWGQPLLVLGGDAQGALAYRTLLAMPELGLRPVGILDYLHHHWEPTGDVSPDWFVGPLSDAGRIAAEKKVFWGLVSTGRHADDNLPRMIDRYACAIPHLLLLTNAGTAPRLWRGAFECGDLAGLRIDERLQLPFPRLVKRVSDVALTALGCLVILPLVALIASAIKSTSAGPLFYSQERIGLGGRRFRAWKFRTMVPNADQVLADYLRRHPELEAEWKLTRKLKHDPRVTRVGRILRKTSLDELPQLWNVLKGDMSLVGPRPIVQDEIAKYGDGYLLYLRVVPGITGLWQISGRNDTTYEKRVALDMFYARNWSIWFDLQILCSTVDVVLHCRGAY